MRDNQDIQAIAESVNKRLSLITNVLAKNSARVKKLKEEVNEIKFINSGDKKEKAEEKGMLALTSSMNIIASSLQRINGSLAKLVGGAKIEGAPGAAPAAPSPGKAKPEDKEDTGIFGLFKSLFTNPAVIAALAGVVYTILPKEVQNEIKGFFSGFSEGVQEAMGENEEEGFKGFNTAIKLAGVAIATVFGAKIIGGVISAISTTLKIIRMLGAGKKLLGKMGTAGALVVAGGAAAGAIAMSGSDEEEKKDEEGAAPEGTPPSTEAPPAESKPSTSGVGIKPGAKGTGIKPGAKGTGIKVPEMTGEDKPVMDMIKQHEGVRTRPYKDSLGLWTVGVGHLIGDGKSLPPEYDREFTMQEVDALFAKDYKHHKEAAQKIPGYEKLNNSGKAALIDLTFNMGPAWYKKWPKFTKALADGNLEQAAAQLEDSKWYGQVGNRARTIVALIRNGGAQTGSTALAESTPSDKDVGAEPVSTGGTSGSQVAQATQAVKEKKEPAPPVEMAQINNQSSTQEEGGRSTSPIPSPIANRGSLNGYVKHSTSYA